jgi:hypothetical protein
VIVLGIDPGENTGLAVYDSTTKKVLWWHLGFPWVQNLAFPGPDSVCLEIPRIYPGGGTKNPGDIITLALTAGELRRWAKQLGKAVKEVNPQEWKGQLPKPAKASDPYIVANRIKARATCGEWPDAILAPSMAHNVYDAIGIAMHGAGHSIK